MYIVLFVLLGVILLVLSLVLSKQKKALLDFDDRIKLLESAMIKLKNSENLVNER